MGLVGWLLLTLLTPVPTSAQEVRPIRDDVGFCWDAAQMTRLVEYLKEHDAGASTTEPLVAGISPHDDYLYAARVYFPLFKSLRAKEVVIFGVTHGSVRKEIQDLQNVIILDEFAAWRGAGADVAVSPLRQRLRMNLDRKYFIVNNAAHRLEHSIEALVPFVQYFNHGVRITPIMVTAMPMEKMQEASEAVATVIAGYVRENGLLPGRDIVFLISSDANHYGKDFSNTPFGEDSAAHRRGTELDQTFVRDYLTGRIEKSKITDLTRNIWGDKFTDSKNTLWCGRYSIPFGMLTAMKTIKKATGKDLYGTLLNYSDTYSGGGLPLTKTGMGLTAPFSLKHWVGFFSISYSMR
jgi:AmmeMemoRadiSam system protein B